jgi:hypothetical protein
MSTAPIHALHVAAASQGRYRQADATPPCVSRIMGHPAEGRGLQPHSFRWGGIQAVRTEAVHELY